MKEKIISVALTEREAYAISRGAESETLEQVGEKFGITRERVRQIEAKAWAIIRQVLKNKTDDKSNN